MKKAANAFLWVNLVVFLVAVGFFCYGVWNPLPELPFSNQFFYILYFFFGSNLMIAGAVLALLARKKEGFRSKGEKYAARILFWLGVAMFAFVFVFFAYEFTRMSMPPLMPIEMIYVIYKVYAALLACVLLGSAFISLRPFSKA